MLMLLSPAKRLVEGPAVPELLATQPALIRDAEVLMGVLRPLSASALSKLMGMSEALGTLNAARHQRWATPLTRETARQAVRLFDGDVYKGLDAASLSLEDLGFAQEHVAILSGLYGVLRPLDLTLPYRLEMGTKLANPGGPNLYAWWKDRIAPTLAKARPSAVVNLASNEYFRAVDPGQLGVPVITPVFKDVKAGTARTLGYFAKQARGAMVRWAVQERVTNAVGLKDCDAMGYRFAADQSTDVRWVFTRPQPPPPRKR